MRDKEPLLLPTLHSFERAAASSIAEAAPANAKVEGSTTSFPSPFRSPCILAIETRLAARPPPIDVATLNRPTAAAQVLHEMIGMADREHFVALYLNSRHAITHAHVVSTGTLQSSMVHPREVFKGALLANAAAIIVGHNHPSGVVSPSTEDEEVRLKLTKAGELVGIPVLDALIVTPGRTFHAHSVGVAERVHLTDLESGAAAPSPPPP